jgi:hypothetical protein
MVDVNPGPPYWATAVDGVVVMPVLSDGLGIDGFLADPDEALTPPLRALTVASAELVNSQESWHPG